MKRLSLWLCLVALLAEGCCAYKTCNHGGKTLCYIENSGWKLFNLIPIASGDPASPNENTPLWFTDTVTLETNMALLKRVMVERRLRHTRDLTSYRSEELIIPFLCKRYIYHTSVELLK